MHIVTGGAGFIGSAMVWKMNRMGIDDIWIVDNLGTDGKWKNLPGLRFSEIMGSQEFLECLERDGGLPKGTKSVVHMGACSSTTENDADYLLKNNYEFGRLIAESSIEVGARLLVASSAAVYGAGEYEYDDDAENLDKLRPLNMYGYSKLLFDRWAERSGLQKKFAGLRFFNVYGPNEYHKGDMASMVFKAFRQIRETGTIRLFKSHREDFADGEQKRDFVYVKDVVDAMAWLLEHPEANGLFNIGAGRAESWNELADSTFAAMGAETRITYVEMPKELRGQYQYLTLADTARLRRAGYRGEFRTVREGVTDYVRNHLAQANPHIDNPATAGQ